LSNQIRFDVFGAFLRNTALLRLAVFIAGKKREKKKKKQKKKKIEKLGCFSCLDSAKRYENDRRERDDGSRRDNVS